MCEFTNMSFPLSYEIKALAASCETPFLCAHRSEIYEFLREMELLCNGKLRAELSAEISS